MTISMYFKHSGAKTVGNFDVGMVTYFVSMGFKKKMQFNVGKYNNNHFRKHPGKFNIH